MFQCPLGLELLRVILPPNFTDVYLGFNALSGLSCYWISSSLRLRLSRFNALSGLSCYDEYDGFAIKVMSFNALSGLSCYGKNAQYFKFFMMLFMHTCYL